MSELKNSGLTLLPSTSTPVKWDINNDIIEENGLREAVMSKENYSKLEIDLKFQNLENKTENKLNIIEEKLNTLEVKVDGKFEAMNEKFNTVNAKLDSTNKLLWWIMGVISAGIIIPVVTLVVKIIITK